MPSIVPGFEYDIFISYRHKDNKGDHWVTEFVAALKTELEATFKEDISIYFDENPHDGLLETHDVDDSLRDKLKCLIFIPIISQTYCDPKSFAWTSEFLAFKKLAGNDQIGLKVKIGNGNVTSRILPVKIHELDVDDKELLESELGPLRSIDFIFKAPGVNRPLRAREDYANDNLNKTHYRNQVNKVANSVKEIIYAVKSGRKQAPINDEGHQQKPSIKPKILKLAAIILLVLASTFYFFADHIVPAGEQQQQFDEALDKADNYLDEESRFQDVRYRISAIDICRKVLEKDSGNIRAWSTLVKIYLDNRDTTAHFLAKIFSIDSTDIHAFISRALVKGSNHSYSSAIRDLLKAEQMQPQNEDVLELLADFYQSEGEYIQAWQYAKKYENASGKVLYETLSQMYLELGDFEKALNYLQLRDRSNDFSCSDVEGYQRIYLCDGRFQELEQVTDSICQAMECDVCPFWKLRAKLFAGNIQDAGKLVNESIKKQGMLGWHLPAYVLQKVGKRDSAFLLTEKELQRADELIQDTTYRLSLPYYTKAVVYAMRGDYEESMKWLRLYASKGFVWGSEWYIAREPLFDGLKADSRYLPEFLQIIQKPQVTKLAIREKIRELENEEGK
jgi:cytochrome c-type biogenesis protein CcmH/NrfG